MKNLLRSGNIRGLLILFVLAASLLAVLSTGVVRDHLIPTFLKLIIGVRIVYGTLPQIAWWILLVVLFMVIASISLVVQTKNTSEETTPTRQIPSRLEHWINLLEQSNKGGYFAWNLAHEISLLTAQVLEVNEKENRRRLASIIASEKYNLDPEIQKYILTGMDAQESFQKSKFFLREFLNEKKSPLDIDTEVMIRFLEKQLDIEQHSTEVTNGNEH